MIIGFLGHADALDGRHVSLVLETTAPDQLTSESITLDDLRRVFPGF
ncbi:MAG: hypothetical protein JO272_14955 [Pseudonocardiales bacterium]|nr:hypothetical protein [Pseudonocardiales bacterium]